MENLESRFETIAKMAEVLVKEMEELKRDAVTNEVLLSESELKEMDMKNLIRILPSHASESSRMAKKMTGIRDERRKFKLNSALHEKLSSSVNVTIKQLESLQREVKNAIEEKPLYFYRSKEIFDFIESFPQAENRSKVPYFLKEEPVEVKKQELLLEKKEHPYTIQSKKVKGKRMWRVKLKSLLLAESFDLYIVLKTMENYPEKPYQVPEGGLPLLVKELEEMDESKKDISKKFLALLQK